MSKDADPAADPAEEDSSDKFPLRLSQEMRVATREAHSLSDHLVNLKLGVALSDDAVWAEGLLVFYEVFRFLELAAERRADSLLGELRVPGLMDRTKAFEKDLRFYLGEGWNGKDYEVRPQVAAYLRHLQGLEEVEPYLLIAYFYHLYMGLLSGGQVLRGKRRLLRKVPLMGKDENGGSDDNGSEANPGEAVVHFTRPIPVLKKEMREAADRVGEELDPETRSKVVKEGITVFELNNTIITSVRGVNDIFFRRVLIFLAALSGVAAVVAYLWFGR